MHAAVAGKHASSNGQFAMSTNGQFVMQCPVSNISNHVWINLGHFHNGIRSGSTMYTGHYQVGVDSPQANMTKCYCYIKTHLRKISGLMNTLDNYVVELGLYSSFPIHCELAITIMQIKLY